MAAAEEDLRVQQQRYNLGASTLLEVLNSQTALNTAQQQLISARQTYRVALEVYVKDPTVSPVSIQPIVQQSAQWNLVDAKLASSTPLSAYYDNSYVEEIKRSGFLSELWR